MNKNEVINDLLFQLDIINSKLAKAETARSQQMLDERAAEIMDQITMIQLSNDQ